MKKTRVLATITAIAMLAMGIGYAAWSQALPMHVGGTLGSFEMIVDSASGNGVANADIAVSTDRKAVTLSASGLYPDSCRQSVYTVTFKNTGTIPVKLSSYSIYGIRGPVGALTVGIAELSGREGKEVAVNLSADNTVESPSQTIVPVNGTMTIKVYVTMLSSVGNEYNFTDPDRRAFAFTVCPNFIQ